MNTLKIISSYFILERDINHLAIKARKKPKYSSLLCYEVQRKWRGKEKQKERATVPGFTTNLFVENFKDLATSLEIHYPDKHTKNNFLRYTSTRYIPPRHKDKSKYERSILVYYATKCNRNKKRKKRGKKEQLNPFNDRSIAEPKITR